MIVGQNKLCKKIVTFIMVITMFGCSFNNPFLETNLKSRDSNGLNEEKITVNIITEWTRILGVAGTYTYSKGMTSDTSGNIYIAGTTYGDLDGQTLTGTDGLFVIKYTSNGDKQWTRLLGVSGAETWSYCVTSDSNGNIYVAGTTYGDLDNEYLAGTSDLFVVKYNSSGDKQWTKLLGIAGAYTAAYGITADQDGNIYATGNTSGNLGGQILTGKQDLFVVKYNPSGDKQWTRLLGVTGNCYTSSYSIISDPSGNVYAAGNTNGNLGGQTLTGSYDSFVVKYNSTGDIQWTRLLGISSRDTRSFHITSDSNGNIYSSGTTTGGLDKQALTGTEDSFIVKYNSYGDKQWTRLFGVSNSNSISLCITSDADGNAFITGYTESLSTGIQDLFEVRYNPNGVRQNIFLQESSGQISGQGILTDTNGNIYITGSTTADLNGQTVTGNSDLFLIKYNQNIITNPSN